jgi:CheY-like chemotaxis protein
MGHVASASPSRHRAHRRKPQALPVASVRPALRVLVVDDSPVNRMIALAQLEQLDVTPVLADDGAQAVALACGETFDLILMDLQMPVLDGLGATAQIRRFEHEHASPRVPVVAYTSCAVGSDAAFIRDFGLDAVLEKPCGLTALRECLLSWCPAPVTILGDPQATLPMAPRAVRKATRPSHQAEPQPRARG